MHFLHLAKITMIAIAFLKTPPTHITKLIHISVASQIYQLEASASAFFSLCQSYDDWFNLSKASDTYFSIGPALDCPVGKKKVTWPSSETLVRLF